MNIQIEVLQQQPPSGEVSADGGDRRPFSGWLQLLRILSDVLTGEAVLTAENETK